MTHCEQCGKEIKEGDRIGILSNGKLIRSGDFDGETSQVCGNCYEKAITIHYQEIKDMRARFHALWSKAVGQKDYKKDEWTNFRQDVYRLAGISL